MPTNNFLPFCPTDTGTNLLSESDYTAATDRTSGNKPGVASSKLNNKAMRQANFITSQVAQYISDKTGTDLLDDADTAKLLSQINAAVLPVIPTLTRYTSGSGTHNLTYYFFIASGNATAAATYTNNGVTYTVKSTVSGAVQVQMTGNGAPSVSGTLTKASGTGDATLTFYAVRAPLYVVASLVGSGGSGAGGGSGGFDGVDGDDTTFGNLTAGKGSKGTAGNSNGGVGGTVTVGSGWVAIDSVAGGAGGAGKDAAGGGSNGGSGGASFFGGQGTPGGIILTGAAAAANSGGGGAGGSGNGQVPASGGGAGAYVKAMTSGVPSGGYAYSVGAAKTGSGAGTGGGPGSNSGSGEITLMEYYQ